MRRETGGRNASFPYARPVGCAENEFSQCSLTPWWLSSTAHPQKSLGFAQQKIDPLSGYGGEVPFSILKNKMGLSRIRRRGHAKTTLSVLLAATALNILRTHQWLLRKAREALSKNENQRFCSLATRPFRILGPRSAQKNSPGCFKGKTSRPWLLSLSRLFAGTSRMGQNLMP